MSLVTVPIFDGLIDSSYDSTKKAGSYNIGFTTTGFIEFTAPYAESPLNPDNGIRSVIGGSQIFGRVVAGGPLWALTDLSYGEQYSVPIAGNNVTMRQTFLPAQYVEFYPQWYDTFYPGFTAKLIVKLSYFKDTGLFATN